MLAEELMSLARVQFIITLVIFLFCMIFLPRLGFGGMTMRIYPCLTAGYFILFLMYAEIISTHFSEIWYGIGLVAGCFVGWSVAYARIRNMEKNLDIHIFCNGHLLKRTKGTCPSPKVFDRYQGDTEERMKES